MTGGRGPGGRGGRNFLTEEELQNRPAVTGALLLRIGGWLRPYWRQLLAVFIAILTSSILRLLPAVLTGRIIDEGLIGRDLPLLVRLIGLSLLVSLSANLIGVLESYLNNWIAQHITFDMRNRMFRHLQTMSHRFYTTNNQGDIITRMTGDIAGVQSVITNTLTSIVTNVLTLVVAIAAMYRKNWILATIGVVIVPLFTIPTRRVGKTRWELTRESQACSDEINGILNETLSVSGQLLVKLFCREDEEYSRYERANRRMVALNIRESMAGRWFRVALSTFSGIGPMLFYFVGGLMMIRYDADLTVGDITVLVSLLGRMYAPVSSLLSIQVDWIRSMALFTRIFEYFDMPAEIRNAPDALRPAAAEGAVRFENVHFSYEPGREILKGISFDLPKGKSIAIVGPSGAGKSTVINLIPRLYDVTGGRITFDGQDVRRLDLEFLRSNIGVVTQDTYLFNGTIRENLLYARPDATEADCIEACKQANIHDFIMAQPDGYDTVVGNRGLKLSGGEKQRISIARVLLKDPALLIFDEATSALDSISESAIQSAIDPLVASHTSILIAHRLSTILAADEILVLKDGEIAERGTHADLVHLGGVYTELYETQFRKALETRVD
ncbi:MAG: ABC transporter ATP-binding protein [Clostridia bacterium]|nr:ABC transporter ATP-binding protein [Clostridia bacterium]MBQ9925122.1 ABC transporter ATP-binding protein [Clostridia bacterium]